MTREEAIEVLENGEWWEELSEWYMVVHPEHDKLHDAVDMAVSALRQQEPVSNRNEPLTNVQKIRSMSDEELAEFLIDLADDGNLRIRDWLQQPAEEDDHVV